MFKCLQPVLLLLLWQLMLGLHADRILQAEPYGQCKSTANVQLAGCKCGQLYYDGVVKYVVNCTNLALNDTQILTQLPAEIEVLIFTGNFLRELPVNVFGQLNNLSRLQTIDMSNNRIEIIHGKSYHRVANVQKLILNHNDLQIDDLNHYSRIFSNFINLLELHLTNAFSDQSSGRRKEFSDDLYDIFVKSNLTKLYKLHLEQNEIEHFHERNLFCNLPNLHDIYLSNNLIETFDFNIDCLTKIRFVDLQSNRIESVNETHLNLLDRIANNVAHNFEQKFIVDFNGNEFHCDSRFVQFYEWIVKTNVIVRDFKKLNCYKYTKGLKQIILIGDYYDEQIAKKTFEVTGTNYVSYFASILFVIVIVISVLIFSVFLFVNSNYFQAKFKRSGIFYTKIETNHHRVYNL